MAEYDIAFAERLASTAHLVVAEGLSDLDARRAVLYLSLLSIEIALKSMLEQAGRSAREIRNRSHRLAKLLEDLGQCLIEVDVTPDVRKQVSASRLRSCRIRRGSAQATVGKIIGAEGNGITSQYPNEVRYGDVLRNYPPEVVAAAASKTVAFARTHWHTLRIR